MATPAKIDIDNLPTITLVGRANVGKSTLFNKLIEENKAMISKIAGTTRNNNEGLMIWRGRYVKIIDTGGMDPEENELFVEEIIDQAKKAILESNIILFIVDGQNGILPQDKYIAKKINTLNKEHVPVFLVVNKVDNAELDIENETIGWRKLKLGLPIFISSANGRNIGDLLDFLYTQLQKTKTRPKSKILSSDDSIKVSLVGKPNVGKSSLFNKLIGLEKVIVSPVAHTTREPFNTTVTYQENPEDKKHFITFIDTAGIRRKSKVDKGLESKGIQKSIETIGESDIILLVLDGKEIISSQDMQLGGLLEKRAKSVIILINKWDLAENVDDSYRNEVKKMVYNYFPHLDFAPILFVSGKTGLKIQQIFPFIIKANEARKTEITANALDKFLLQIIHHHLPSRGKGVKHPRLIALKQIAINPPVFELVVKTKTSLHSSYLSYIKNQLRDKFNFFGSPIIIKISKTKKL